MLRKCSYLSGTFPYSAPLGASFAGRESSRNYNNEFLNQLRVNAREKREARGWIGRKELAELCVYVPHPPSAPVQREPELTGAV